MAVNLSPIWGAGAQLLDNSGNVLSGGKIYTYAAGTTTPAATYTSSNGITANSNPIILNSAGRVPYEIWLTDTLAYKFVLKDSNDTLIATYDNLVGINSNFIAYTAQQEIQTATAGQTVFNLTTMQYQPGTNNLSVFVDGVNQYGPGAQYAYVETDTDTVTFVSGLHVGASVKFTTATQVSSASTDAANVSFTGVKGQSGSVADLGTIDGSDWVGFQPAGTGAVSANYSIQDKLRQTVSVKDFGAVGDGVTDDTAAIQAALDYAGLSHCQVNIPAGIYVTSDTLYIDSNNVIVYGQGNPSYGAGASRGLSNDVTEGPVIQYTGTTCALQVSKSRSANPNADATNPGFISGIQIYNLRIEVPANCVLAMHNYQASNSYFFNIALWGNQAAGTTLLKVSAGIDNIYEKINAIGIGRYTSPVPDNTYYTENGLYASLGYANDLATTTIFRRCYFHYCNYGVWLSYIFEFEDCIFESCRYGVYVQADVTTSFNRCWWEANTQYDVYFNNTNAVFTNCRINSYTRQQFFATGSGVKNLKFENVEFKTTNANPYIFGVNPSGNNIFNASLTYPAEIIFNSCQFPSNIKTGYIYTNSTTNLIQIGNMRKETYRFTASSVGASATPTMNAASGFTSYTMPENGHFIGLNIYTSSAVSAGSYNIAVKLNGTSVTSLSYPAIGILTTTPYRNRITPFLEKFSKGDVLSVYFNTDGSWSPSNNVCFEVLTAIGPSGEV